MTKLLLIEPEATGHRMVLYVRLIAEEALRRGWNVTLMTTASALSHTASHTVASALGFDLNIVKMPEINCEGGFEKHKLLFRQRGYLHAFRKGYREYRKTSSVDFVYIPYLNYIDKICGLYGSPFGSTPFGGMIVSANFHHRSCGISGPIRLQDAVGKILFKRLLQIRTLSLATTIDEPLPQYVAQKMPALAAKVRYVPDASFILQPSERYSARRALGLEEDNFVVVAYGSLSPRKGLSRLMSMFAAADLPKHFRLVLAGLQDAEAAKIINSFMSEVGERRSQVIILNRFCSELEEGWVFAAADVVWLCYENFSGMSGVLIQSAQAGVPVITASYGLIDHNRARRSLGLRWDDVLVTSHPKPRFNWSVLESAVHEIRGSSQLAAFADEHSPKNFGFNVVNEIAEESCVEGRA